MAETFHWIIFALHFAAALVITYGVWWRCDQRLWTSRMHADAYRLPSTTGNSSLPPAALWWDSFNLTRAAACASQESPDAGCFIEGIPTYEVAVPGLGWHLFCLLGHFKWLSSAFAFFYIDGPWRQMSWAISTALAATGTLIYLPWTSGQLFLNEVLLLLANAGLCAGVFHAHRDVHRQLAEADPPSAPPQDLVEASAPPRTRGAFRVPAQWKRVTPLQGLGNLRAGSLRLATLPALRFAEYTITASELFVAVLSLFVADAPAFMSLGGYALVMLCNLYGALLHYSLVADHADPSGPELQAGCARGWRELVIPRGWLRVDPPPPSAVTAPTLPAVHGWGWSEEFLSRRYAWGSFIASNTSTLLNSWMAFALAMVLVFYQQTFLFSSDPPWFVVMSGWSLLVFYTSFGVWVTAVYLYPERVGGLFARSGQPLEETYLLVVRGLDILSVLAKLTVVSFLSFGFVFSADGRC